MSTKYVKYLAGDSFRVCCLWLHCAGRVSLGLADTDFHWHLIGRACAHMWPCTGDGRVQMFVTHAGWQQSAEDPV